MATIYDSITTAKDEVLGNDGTHSGQEPPSGIKGQGTVDSPYDQGNAPAQATGTGTEPPSGQQGQGTIDSPYDKGNQPENPTSTDTPISDSSKPSTTTTQPTSSEPVVPSSTNDQGSGNLATATTPAQETTTSESRGRDETAQHTTSTAPAGAATEADNFGAATKDSRFERSMSPGQLDDGTHVRTGAGAKASKGLPIGKSSDQASAEGSKMDKLKGKLFGRH